MVEKKSVVPFQYSADVVEKKKPLSYAARFESKRPPKVVVYTPLVTVPAFPVIEPLIVEENVLVPEKVLLSLRSEEEAAEMVMFEPRLKVVPLIEPRDPLMRLAPIVDEAITLPVSSTARSADARFPIVKLSAERLVVEAVAKYPVPLADMFVVEAFWKVVKPEKVLLSERSVVEAALNTVTDFQ